LVWDRRADVAMLQIRRFSAADCRGMKSDLFIAQTVPI